MNIYKIFSTLENNNIIYEKHFNNYQEAVQWIENTLDLSQNWDIRLIK